MKPDWKDAPEWANWLAMDWDGEWFWYQSEPEISGGDGRWQCNGRAGFAGKSEVESLPVEKRP